jgi:hypothetical protein
MKWDLLFEWALSQKQRSPRSLIIRDRLGRERVYALQRTDIENIHLGYNERGQLSLADVKPTGFLVSKRA